MEHLTWYIGMAATLLNMVALIPQVVKGFKTHQVCDLSWGWLEMIFVATLLWLIYGILLHDLPLILANSVAGICYMLLIGQKIWFKCR